MGDGITGANECVAGCRDHDKPQQVSQCQHKLGVKSSAHQQAQCGKRRNAYHKDNGSESETDECGSPTKYACSDPQNQRLEATHRDDSHDFAEDDGPWRHP